MATGQTLLDTMELLNQELQLQSGEADVTRALVALNRAQDYFESILASERGVKGDATGTITTTASTETSNFPDNLLRLDRLVLLNSTTLRPEAELEAIHGTYGPTISWPDSIYLVAGTGTGKPRGYVTNGRYIYWTPLPDATYTVRWYGLRGSTDITASGVFCWLDGQPIDDILVLPIASFATRLMKLGLDDDQGDIATLAENTFRPAIKALSNFHRDGARGLRFRYSHET